LIVELKHRNGKEEELHYNTQEGHAKYVRDFMPNKYIFFGRLIEVYNDGTKVRRASFCNG
jgi:hypothetical protein